MEDRQDLTGKSDLELEEILRESPHSSQLHRDAQSERDRREQERMQRPARTQAIVAAILCVIAILAYLRAC